MKAIDYVLVLALAITLLTRCGKVSETQAESIPPSEEGAAAPSDARGLDPVSREALGTLKLESTENALTPAQAGELLPLWQMIQSGSLQGDAETNAIVQQVEGVMSGPQLAAINAMQPEGQDIQAWMQEQGIEPPAPPAGQGSPGALQNLSEEERAQMREEFQNMSPEQRATRMAEMGIEPPQGEGAGDIPGARPGDGGQSNFLLDPLVKLLTERAAEVWK